MSNNVEELKRKEEELVAQATGNPQPKEATPEPEVESHSTESDSTDTKRKYTDWKKRFINYKSGTDATINELRTENSALKSSMLATNQRLASLEEALAKTAQPTDTFKGVFTDKQEAAFGEEGLEVVKKAATTAAKAESEPLKAELARERKLRMEAEAKSAKDQAKRNYDTFLGILKREVPDYQVIDKDKRFHEWMSLKDPKSIYSRRKLFQDAEKSLNAGVVAQYMIDFKKAIGITPSNPAIDRHIAPSAASSGADPSKHGKPKSMSMAWITQFTEDVTRGKYKDNMAEAKRIQAEIDAHLNAGLPLSR